MKLELLHLNKVVARLEYDGDVITRLEAVDAVELSRVIGDNETDDMERRINTWMYRRIIDDSREDYITILKLYGVNSAIGLSIKNKCLSRQDAYWVREAGAVERGERQQE
jgi:hypothetical protein